MAELSCDKVTVFFTQIYGLPQTLGFILSMIWLGRYDYNIEAQGFVQVSIMYNSLRAPLAANVIT